MKVSLITVTYNSSDTIADCVKSVTTQTYPDIEHIIVDGASTDNTIGIIRSLPTRVKRIVSEPDKGIYDAMNKGIEMATGDIVGLINSDDLFCDPLAIEKVMRVFNENEHLESVYADLYYVSRNDTAKIIRHWRSGVRRSFRVGWHPAHPTLYLRKIVYQKYGLFNLDFKLAADFEIMLRFLEKHKISTFYLQEFLVKMRLGGTTNRSLRNIIRQNIECINAFKVNDLEVNDYLYTVYRILPKILQFKK